MFAVSLLPVLRYSAQKMVMIGLINVFCFIRSWKSQNFPGFFLSVENVERLLNRLLTVFEIILARYESQC